MADSGTYDQATLLRRQKIADAMLEDSRKTKPIRHWAEGLSQVADAGMAGYFSNKVDQEGKASRAADTAALASLLSGGAPAPTAAPVSPVAAPEAAPQANPVVAAMSGGPDYGKAIANIESGGAYDKLGPVTKTGDRAYGKYQVMGNNIPEWSKAATGREMTPQEFAASPAAQDAIFKQRFGSYVDKYGPEGAAKAWFAGEKGMNNPNAKDQLGTSVESYGKKFMSGLGGGAPQAPVAQAMAPPQMPAGQPAAAGGPLAGASPQQREFILKGMQASEGSPARAIAMSMATQLMKPQEFGFQNQPDGTILRTNPRTGTVEPVYQGATKPTFGDTGEVDPQTGQPVKGFIDPTKQTVTPYKPQPAAAAQPSTIPPVPPGVDPKVWREAQSKRATEDGMPADTKVTSALRNEIQGLPSYKNLAQAAPVYRAMSEAAGRDNRAADLNLIYGFGKIMDPGSVVRESEMTMAEKINTLPQYLRATAESQLSGSGRLSPEVRAQILEEAHTRIQSYKGLFDQDSGMYRGIAKRGRMNEEDVIPNFGEFPSWAPPKASAPVEIDGYKIRAK